MPSPRKIDRYWPAMSGVDHAAGFDVHILDLFYDFGGKHGY
jgi:hypothetical protein